MTKYVKYYLIYYYKKILVCFAAIDAKYMPEIFLFYRNFFKGLCILLNTGIIYILKLSLDSLIIDTNACQCSAVGIRLAEQLIKCAIISFSIDFIEKNNGIQKALCHFLNTGNDANLL